jgi:hypothetical protein
MGGGGKDRVVKRGDIAEMGMGMNRVMNIMGN